MDGGTDYDAAQADSESNSTGVVGISDGSNGVVVAGLITGLTGLTPGQPVYLDPSVSGGYTATVPTTTGETGVVLGDAVSTTTMIVEVAEPIQL